MHSVYIIENVSDSPASANNGTEAGHITADSVIAEKRINEVYSALESGKRKIDGYTVYITKDSSKVGI